MVWGSPRRKRSNAPGRAVMSFLLGLTGSIGMGKSTTAKMFSNAGIPVWDADECVHRLYAADAPGAALIAEIAPQAIGPNGVDRKVLRSVISEDGSRLKRIEAAIHPLVAADRASFIAKQSSEIVVLEIPLLFETGAEQALDAVAVVSTDAASQRDRVLARPGMTAATFDLILSKQMSDAEKKERADYIIDTTTLASAEADVDKVIRAIMAAQNHA